MEKICYVVCVDDGFYMEPDISVVKVFLDYKKAKQYVSKLKAERHRSIFIEKTIIDI